MAITEHQEPRQRPAGWQGMEAGPSVLREDEMALPRSMGVIGAALVVFGGMALGLNLAEKQVRVSAAWAAFCLALGLAGLLFHAAFDRDVQFRRVYLAFSYAALVVGVILCAFAKSGPTVSGYRFLSGYLCLGLAGLFQLATHRNETDAFVRRVMEFTLGGAGAIMALVGLVGGNISAPFLLPYGLLLSVLGLFYLAGFVGSRGTSDELAYRTGWGIGAAGVLVFLVVLVRSFVARLPGDYLATQGLILAGVACLYVAVAAGLCLDWPLVVLARRELGAFFYSPMAYLALLGFSILSWVNYKWFFEELHEASNAGGLIVEPILLYYFYSLLPVFALVFIVPALTMRLLSEEKRSGTLEVLMTAPVGESTVVLSKFLAAFLTYLLLWAPFCLYLIALPLGGAPPFDYRPLLSFFIVLAVAGAGFISMGLFFSSLTSNQVVSAVLTFVGMCVLTYFHIGRRGMEEDSIGAILFTHLSYLDLWRNALQGWIVPKFLMFYVSMTIVFLFASVKVLESRKWR